MVQRAGEWAQKRLKHLERQQSHGVHALQQPPSQGPSQNSLDRSSQESAGRNHLEGSGATGACGVLPSGGVGSCIANALVQAKSKASPTLDTLLQYRHIDAQAVDRNTAEDTEKETHEDYASTAQQQVMYEVLGADELRDIEGKRSGAVSRFSGDSGSESGLHQGGLGTTSPPRGRRTPVRLAAEAAAIEINNFDAETCEGAL